MPDLDPASGPPAADFQTALPPSSPFAEGVPPRHETERESWLSAILEDHRRRWDQGERVRVERYLQRLPELGQDEEALLDLIYQGILRREEQGESPSLTEFVERFPTLRGPLERQFSVQRALQANSVLGTDSLSERPAEKPSDGADPYATASVAVTPIVPADPYATVDIVPSPAGSEKAARYPTVAGYDILGTLGRGGMGVVYKARQQGLKRLVALKMIRDAALAGTHELARFQTEAQALASLQHPNIVQVFEVGSSDGLPFFSLEFVGGGSLDRKLKRTPQPPRWCAETLELLARAVGAAHQRNIVHRDLKPANVLLTKEGTLKITDFGLAKQLDRDSEQTHAGAIMGTPNYMAPEQAAGEMRDVGPLSDVYALGVILYEMLTGRLPLVGPTVLDTLTLVRFIDPVPPTQLQPKVPRDLETICLKCLRKDPARRYAGAVDLADDLRRWQNGEPIKARPVALRERLVKWVRRHPALSSLYAVLTVLPILLFAFLFTRIDALEKQYQLTVIDLQKSHAREDARIQFLPTALAEMQNKNWTPARLILARALTRIQDDADLGAAELRMELETHLATARTGEKHLEEFALFENEVNDVFFLEPRMVSDRDALLKARSTAETALRRYGLTKDSDRLVPVVPTDYLRPEQQAKVVTWTWHLLFILSEIDANPLANDDPRAGLKRALAILDRLAAVSPATQSLHNQRAIYLDKLGDAAGARAARRLAPTQPIDAADYLRSGTLLLLAGKADQAAPAFQEVLRQEHNPFWVLYWLSFCQMQAAAAEPRTAEALTLLAAAEAQLNHCVKQRPDFAWGYILRGNARAEQGNREARRFPEAKKAGEYRERAEQDFQAAEKCRRDDEATYGLLTGRGALRLAGGRCSDAIQDLEAARRLKPRPVQAYLLLAEVYRQQPMLGNPLTPLDEAIKQNPTKASLYRTRGHARQGMGKDHFAAALQDYDQAIALEKAHPEADLDPALLQLERGELLHQQQDHAAAVAAYDAALEKRPNLTRAYLVRGEALFELTDREADPDAKRRGYQKALRSVEEYMRRSRPEASDYSLRAAVRSRLALSLSTAAGAPELMAVYQKESLDHYQGAVEDYSLALHLNPTAETYARRGWTLLLMLEAPKLALPDFRRVVEATPKDAAALAGRGLCLAHRGAWHEAAADGENALALEKKEKRPTTFLVYNVARTYALASRRLAELPAPDAQQRALRVHYQDRSVELIRQALDLRPPEQRQAFWRESVRGDQALTAVRTSTAYGELAKQYEKKGPAKD